MSRKLCKKPTLIKNKFVSTVLGTLGIYIGIGFIYPMSYLSVYITSYIHINQDFVNMHYGYFFNLIMTLSMSFSASLGGILESKIGFVFTTLLGTTIILIADLFFFKMQNIWICYILTCVIGIGAGISASLLGKNITFYYPKKKGIIVSIIGMVLIVIAGIYLILGEKLIASEGETLGEDKEVYSEEIAENTYKYFMLGFISIPLGDIIFILFIQEYRGNRNEKIINLLSNNSDENKIEIEETSKDIEGINDGSQNEESEKEEISNENKEKINEEKQKTTNILEELENDEANKKKKIKKIIKTFRFWRIAAASFLSSFPISFMMTTGRTFGALIGIKGGALQFLTAAQGVSLLVFGPILGFISDKKGPLNILRISSIISIIPGVLLLFFIDNTVLFLIAFAIIAIGLVSKMVSFSPLLMEIYGIQESVILGGIINGVGKLSEVITTVSAFVISFYYKGDEIKIPYKILFIVGSSCSALSFVLLMFESRKKYEYEKEADDLNQLVDNDNITEAEMNNKSNN